MIDRMSACMYSLLALSAYERRQLRRGERGGKDTCEWGQTQTRAQTENGTPTSTSSEKFIIIFHLPSAFTAAE